MPFRIIRNDITRVKADAIADTVDSEVTVGEATVTHTFGGKAKYVIHACVPVWMGGSQKEETLLGSCYKNALNLAISKKCKSIAFPLMAANTCGFPKELELQIAVAVFECFLQTYEMDITLVVPERDDELMSGEFYEDVSSYILDKQTAKYAAREYRYEGAAGHAPRLQAMRCALAEESCYEADMAETCTSEQSKSLEERLQGMYKDSFAKHLQQLINKKGMKNSEVYVAANISKQYFSKLMKGSVKPSKEKVLALAIGLRLNLDETVDFLRFAGYALSPVSQTDVIVEYFIQKQIYSVMKVDIVLFDYGLPLLSE